MTSCWHSQGLSGTVAISTLGLAAGLVQAAGSDSASAGGCRKLARARGGRKRRATWMRNGSKAAESLLEAIPDRKRHTWTLDTSTYHEPGKLMLRIQRGCNFGGLRFRLECCNGHGSPTTCIGCTVLFCCLTF